MVPLTTDLKKIRDSQYGKRPPAKYKICEYAAKIRGYEFSLTFDQFMNLWRVPCHYCGAEVANIGVDRIDNSKGYFDGNVISACSSCNFAKSSLTLYEFISWIQRAYNYQNSEIAR